METEQPAAEQPAAEPPPAETEPAAEPGQLTFTKQTSNIQYNSDGTLNLPDGHTYTITFFRQTETIENVEGLTPGSEAWEQSAKKIVDLMKRIKLMNDQNSIQENLPITFNLTQGTFYRSQQEPDTTQKQQIQEAYREIKQFASEGAAAITQVPGLTQLGQTCYMNSVLAALFSNPKFILLLKKEPSDNKDNNQKNLRQKLLNLYNKIKEKKPIENTDLQNIRKAANQIRPTEFKNNTQKCDASEFLQLILDSLAPEESDFAFQEVNEINDPSSPTPNQGILILQHSKPEQPPSLEELINQHNIINPPKSFFIHLPIVENTQKPFHQLTIPETISLQHTQSNESDSKPQPQTSQDMHLRSIILHKGPDINQGHYVTLVKEGTQWVLHDNENLDQKWDSLKKALEDLNSTKDPQADHFIPYLINYSV